MRRRTRPGSVAILLIVAAIVVFAIARTVPRGHVADTPTARIPPSVATVSAAATTAALPTPRPIVATATAAIIAPPTATTTPTPPLATATASLLYPTPPTQAPVVPSPTPSSNLTGNVQAIRARDLPDTSSVTILTFDGREAHLDDTRAEYPASTVKLPIYLALAHRIHTGEAGLTWETTITVQHADIVGGTGVLQNAPGSIHTVREIAQLMILESDNVAANILLGRLGGGHDTSQMHVRAGAGVVTGYLDTLGVRGMNVRHGLLDPDAFATGMESTTTSAALAQLLQITENGRTTLDGAADVLTLLGERGTHNPWHPADTLSCGLTVERIGGIYPASPERPGVRLDALMVTTPGIPLRYLLTVIVPTTPALEPTVEARIARFEGDVQLLLTGHWAQCVDSTTRQG